MVFAGGGACVVFARGGVRRIRRDTVNERAVRILLECILVLTIVFVFPNLHNFLFCFQLFLLLFKCCNSFCSTLMKR